MSYRYKKIQTKKKKGRCALVQAPKRGEKIKEENYGRREDKDHSVIPKKKKKLKVYTCWFAD
jgi:hypothetical protein